MKDKIKKGRLVLVDIPVEKEEMDEFRHNIFVNVLLELIRDIEEPCNIGLFGKWGVGKTSIVKMLSNKIGDGKKIKCIYIDAWKYSDESLRTQILLEIDKELGNPIGKEEIIDNLYNIQEEEKEEESGIKSLLLKTWVSWISFFMIAAAILLVYYKFPDKEIVSLIAVCLVGPLLLQLITVIQSASVSVSRRRILPKKEWPGEFEDIFSMIIKKAKYEKIVVIIDNLDRCQSHVVIEMLALLKIFMGSQKCIHIIPCDEEALLGHIGTIDKNGGYFKESGQEFLRKIFQVTIKVPPLLGESLEEYAQRLRSKMRFPFDDNVLDVVAWAYARTPRQIIHTLNKLTTLYLLAQEKEKEKIIKEGIVTSNFAFLAKISIIEDEWKDFYNYLSCNALLLEDIENYFRGLSIDNGTEDRITAFLDRNPRLRDFLYATRAVRADDIEPFLMLSQETYESAIPELERFRLYVYENNTEQVQNIMNRLSDEEKIHHTKEILKITEKAVQNGRFGLGFNCLNVLSHIYGILPDDFRPNIARKVGQCLSRKGMIEFSVSFDYDKLFGIFPLMNENDRDDILTILCSALFTEKQINTVLVTKFVEYSDIIGYRARKGLNDAIISNLDSKIAEDVIFSISKNAIARKNLLEQELLRKVIDRIMMEKGKQEGIDLYLQIKQNADQKTKEEFILKELKYLDEPAPDGSAILSQVLNALLQLDTDDIPPNLTAQLFSKMKREAKKLPIDQRREYFRYIMKNFRIFSDENRSEFLKSEIREVFVSGDPGTVDSVTKNAYEFEVDLLCDEDILDSLLKRIPTPLFQKNILKYLIRYTPRDKDEEIKEKLLSILQGDDQNKFSAALDAIDSQFKYFEEKTSNEISKVCIDRAVRLNDRNIKNMFLTPISKHFSDLPNDRKDSVINCIIHFLQTPNMEEMGKSHYRTIRDFLEKKHKIKFSFELLQRLPLIPDDKLNGGTKDFIEILFDLQSVMKRSEIENFIRHILRMMKDTLSPGQNRAGLHHLSRFENIKELDSSLVDQVLDQLHKAVRSEDEQTSKLARNTLNLWERTKAK